MAGKTQQIEVDDGTALALQKGAAQRGVSVAQLVAELVPLSVTDADIAELERRWAAVKDGEPTMPQVEVDRWLQTWGSRDFRSWNER